MNRVAFQGEPGAFSEEAAVKCCGADALLLPVRSFSDVVGAVLRGAAEQGVLPVENSLIGSVSGAAHAAATPGLIVKEGITLPIHHFLLARSGTSINDITRALSHAAALAQCTLFFAEHPAIEPVEWYDTAGAAKHVALKGDGTTAAIASKRAADRYKLIVLAENIEDRGDNRTRFVVITRDQDAA